MDEFNSEELNYCYQKLRVTFAGAGVQDNSATVFELATRYYEKSHNDSEFIKVLNKLKAEGFELPKTDFEQACFLLALHSM